MENPADTLMAHVDKTNTLIERVDKLAGLSNRQRAERGALLHHR